ncbi:MAG: CysS/YqeB C-terminal domain-containing protein [Solirubrobacteraceae bacterium]
MLHALGLDNLLPGDTSAPDPAAADLLAEREQARSERDFDRADALRDELAELGYTVEDTPGGARLVRPG